MITSEMIDRITAAAYGGSFANDDARKYHVKLIINALFALNIEDLEAIKKEILKNNYSEPLKW